MNEALHSARVVQPPASVASTATTTMTFDTIGFDYAVVDVLLGTAATTDPTLTVLKFLESDDTVVTNRTAIVALTGGTATSTTAGFVIPAATATGVGGAIQFQIDLRKRKRYLTMNTTPGTTQVIGAVVDLCRAEKARLTAAAKSITNRDATSVTGCVSIVNA